MSVKSEFVNRDAIQGQPSCFFDGTQRESVQQESRLFCIGEEGVKLVGISDDIKLRLGALRGGFCH